MLSSAAALSLGGAVAFHGAVPARPCQRATANMESLDDLKTLAVKLNPVVGYWDPLKLAEQNFWGQGEEATIGFLRESEIKHGRIAMFGFVGYIIHSLDIRTPGQFGGAPFASVPTGLSAPAVWDAIPEIAKWQIILFVGVMELVRENKVMLAAEGEKHYMKGGTPGYFPPFTGIPHPVPFSLYDPFGFQKGRSEEAKARGRLVELNNGRLAMIGLFGFLSEATVPGSVPLLKGVVPAYAGEVMAPFATNIFTNPTPL